MANNRVFYASHGVALAKETGDTSLASPIYNRSGTVQGLIAVAGANSVTMNTNFNLEQVFQLGQLELYDNVVTDPSVECTISKTLDGHPSIYELDVGTGGIVGGNVALDNATGGPQKRIEAQATELRLIVREEVRSAIKEAWPKTTGISPGVKVDPSKDYRENTPPRK